LNKKLAYLQDQARKAVEIIPSILLEIEGKRTRKVSSFE